MKIKNLTPLNPSPPTLKPIVPKETISSVQLIEEIRDLNKIGVKLDKIIKLISSAQNRYRRYKRYRTVKKRRKYTSKIGEYKKERLAEEESRDRKESISLLKTISQKLTTPLTSLSTSPLAKFGKDKALKALGYIKGLGKIGMVAGAIVGASKIWDKISTKGLKEGSRDILNGINNFVKRLTGGVVELWSPEAVDRFLDNIERWYGEAKEAMIEFYHNLPQGVQDFLNTAAQTISDTFNRVIEAFPSSWAEAREMFVNLPIKISSLFTDAKESLLTWYEKAKTNLPAALEESAKGFYEALPQPIKDFFSLAKQKVEEWAKEALEVIEGIGGKVKEKIKGVYNEGKKKVEEIYDEKFADIGELMRKNKDGSKSKLILKKLREKLDKEIAEKEKLLKEMGDAYADDSAWGTTKRLAKWGTKEQLRQKIFRESAKIESLKRRKAKADESYIKIEKEIKEREKVIKELETKPKASKEAKQLTGKKEAIEASIQRLLDRIMKGEGTTMKKARKYGYKSPYDILVGYESGERWRVGKHKPLTEMTIAEVKVLQKKMVRHQRKWLKAHGKDPNKASSAVGRYQVMQGTLRDAMRALGLKDTDKFDKETQDKIGRYLLERRGLKKYLAGKMSESRFQKNISLEWASVANPYTKKSSYKQHVGTTDAQIKERLRDLKEATKITHNHYYAKPTTPSTTTPTQQPRQDIKISVDLRPKSKDRKEV
jgi:hypothetical protein